jgi:phage protein D
MRRPVYRISVDGADVTSNFAPLLTQLTITDSDGGKADSLECDLDDTGGWIELPRVGASIEAAIGWDDTGSFVVFEGTVDEVTSTGARGQGHLLTITAKSADVRGKLKQHESKHMDQASFKDAAQQWGRDAGLSNVVVDQALGQIQRAYWAMGNEHFLAWGQRMAHELGATFKVMGDTGVFVTRSSGQSASGKALATVAATWGDNLISWSLSPVLSRPEYQQFIARWYDPKAAKWMAETVQAKTPGTVTGNSPAPASTHRYKTANQQNAKGQAGSASDEADRDRGGGTVTIDGNPSAQSEAQCVVAGVRPGIDGLYRISTATHRLTRHGGYLTDLQLKQPSGSAGTDSRGGSSSGS